MSFWSKLFGEKKEPENGSQTEGPPVFRDKDGNFDPALLDSAADVNLRDAEGRTALMYAAGYSAKGYPEIVSALLGRGADVNLQDERGVTALMFASLMNHADIAEALLDKGADVGLQDKDGGNTALMRAVAGIGRDCMTVELLLDRGAELNQQNERGKTALMNAASRDNAENVAVLLERGADTNIQDEEGWTALMSAAGSEDSAIVSALLDAGADANLQNRYRGWTALMQAARLGRIDNVAVLLERGAEVNLQDHLGKTALLYAAEEEGHVDNVTALLKWGADPNLGDNSGKTALEYAEIRGDAAIIEALREQSDDANLQAQKEGTSITHDTEKQPEATIPLGGQYDGHAAMFVFDYDCMGSSYGIEAFDAIAACLQGSSGACAFLDGDLEIAAGGPSDVPHLLMEIRDNGWVIGTSRADSPLILLASIDHLCGYVAAMWTDNAETIDLLDRNLKDRLPDAYLGFLKHPQSLDLSKFYDIFKPLQLSLRTTYVDGEEKAKQ